MQEDFKKEGLVGSVDSSERSSKVKIEKLPLNFAREAVGELSKHGFLECSGQKPEYSNLS